MKTHLTHLSLLLALLACLQAYPQSPGVYQRMQPYALPGRSELALQSFLRTKIPLLRQGKYTLSLLYEVQSPGGWHYTFGQHYGSFPVFNGGIKVNLNRKGEVISVMNYLKDLPGQSLPDFGPREEAVARSTAEKLGVDAGKFQACYLLQKGKSLPVFQLHRFEEDSGRNELLLFHAQSGELLLREDQNRYAHPADTSGRGRVFMPNPCTKAKVAYGDLFIDNNDQHQAILESLMDTVVLNDLTFEQGRFLLQGPYVKVEDITSPNRQPVSSTDGNFFFRRDSSGFEDVMVYYHIDRFQRYVQSLGFTNLQNGPFRVDAHGSTGDNSAFIPNGPNSYIKYGEGGVDDAEDADVIIHEYGHALSYAAAPGTLSGFERRALDEGIGDYLAARYSQDIDPFEWNKLFNWDGHNEFWSGRDAATLNTYPPEQRNIYAYGEIWASTLMRIRQEIGAEAADRIALQQMYANSIGMSMEDAVQLLLEADSLLYAGIHTDVINFYTCESGLQNRPICLSVGLSPNMPEEEAIRLYPNPNTGRFTVELEGIATPLRLEVFNALGQLVHTRQLLPANSQTIRLHQPPGLYVARFVQANVVRKVHKFVIR
ncbi:MAG: T9SS C-terminal target domain-containing protein [Bacteroidetes bacterium]|nr:MAG: T9SS C-terminal target domain-containing protein [Bacteroidota bacterium]